jgi:hypothetical protein
MTTPVWEIFPYLCGYPSEIRLRRLILPMLRAFFDDSGRGQEPVYVLAGFVARAEAWARFGDAWNEAIHKAPRIEYFKMNEANTRTGQFYGWTEEARDEKILLLATIIKEHVLCGLSVVMKHQDYAEVFKGRIAKRMDQAFFWMYQHTLFLCMKWQTDNGLDEKMDFVFDEQQGESDFILARHDQFMALAPDVFKSKLTRPTFMNDRETPALQAADMYAGHIRSESINPAFNTPTFKIFLNEIPISQGRIDRRDLEEALARLMAVAATKLRLFPHQLDEAASRWEELGTKTNMGLFQNAKPGDVVNLLALRATRTSKYQLVHMCPSVCRPHLHTRYGNECLEATQSRQEQPNGRTQL